jgi:hypothetical protein
VPAEFRRLDRDRRTKARLWGTIQKLGKLASASFSSKCALQELVLITWGFQPGVDEVPQFVRDVALGSMARFVAQVVETGALFTAGEGLSPFPRGGKACEDAQWRTERPGWAPARRAASLYPD